jgi:hypothetical protein
MYNMVLYLCVLIVFSLRRESLKLILAMDPLSRWFCYNFIYLNLMCLGWRNYIPCIASVRLDLDLATTELISFSFDKVAADGHSMISMYVDCGFDALSLAAYPRVGVTTWSMIKVFISICIAYHRQASSR